MNQRRHTCGGFAMILVIWVLVLLSLVAAGFSRLVTVETDTGIWLSEQVQAQAAAQAGVHRALMGLSSRDKEQRWLADGQPREFVWEGLQTSILVRSESGKVDLNYAPEQLLSGLLRQLDSSRDAVALAQALIDWRDRDSNTQEYGAEEPEYQSAGLPYVPANAPLGGVDELSQVLGFDADLVEQLRPFVTIYARRPKIQARSAPLEVIAALPGIGPDVAQQFIELRDLAATQGEPPDFSLLSGAERYYEATDSGGLYAIEVEVALPDHNHREQAVVRLQSARRGVQVLSWEQIAAASDETDTDQKDTEKPPDQ